MTQYDLATQVYAAAHQVDPSAVEPTDTGLDAVRAMLATDRDTAHDTTSTL